MWERKRSCQYISIRVEAAGNWGRLKSDFRRVAHRLPLHSGKPLPELNPNLIGRGGFRPPSKSYDTESLPIIRSGSKYTQTRGLTQCQDKTLQEKQQKSSTYSWSILQKYTSVWEHSIRPFLFRLMYKISKLINLRPQFTSEGVLGIACLKLKACKFIKCYVCNAKSK